MLLGSGSCPIIVKVVNDYRGIGCGNRKFFYYNHTPIITISLPLSRKLAKVLPIIIRLFSSHQSNRCPGGGSARLRWPSLEKNETYRILIFKELIIFYRIRIENSPLRGVFLYVSRILYSLSPQEFNRLLSLMWMVSISGINLSLLYKI